MKEDKAKQQKLQEKYMEMQFIGQQIKQVQSQLQMIDAQLNELIITKEGLSEIEKSKPGSEVLSSLSPGIFIKTELKDNKDILLNVGAGVGVNKSMKEAHELVETQTREIKNVQRQLLDNLQLLNSRVNELEKEMSLITK